MDKKSPKELDKYLRKFAIGGQKKLVAQLRQMLTPSRGKTSPKSGESDKSASHEFSGRDKLFELMDVFRNEPEKYYQPDEQSQPLWLELLCRPINHPDNTDPSFIKRYLQSDITVKIEIIKRKIECIKIQHNNNDSQCYGIYVPENGLFYSRNKTAESKQNRPNIFDPKVQSITIAEALISLGRLYQKLGLNYRDRFDIVFRYSNATNLAIGSISTETFLPSTKYKKEELTFYVVRELHEILNRTADITAEIIIEILKKLRYQGIVNKDFFVHAISKHLAQK